MIIITISSSTATTINSSSRTSTTPALHFASSADATYDATGMRETQLTEP
jgi:hypothetical protein